MSINQEEPIYESGNEEEEEDVEEVEPDGLEDEDDVEEEDVVDDDADEDEDDVEEEGVVDVDVDDIVPEELSMFAKFPEEDMYISEDEDFEEDDNESETENIDIRIDDEYKLDYIKSIHPEETNDSFQSMNEKCMIQRDENQFIVDSNHVTFPILTKYERARILGLRISQLNKGARPLIQYKQLIIDNTIIAEKELREKKLPFIIMRPIPNGGKEYWRLQDLEILDR